MLIKRAEQNTKQCIEFFLILPFLYYMFTPHLYINIQYTIYTSNIYIYTN